MLLSKTGKLKKSLRLKSAKTQLNIFLKKGAKVALVSHLGRPEGKKDKNLSLRQLQDEVSKIFGKRELCLFPTV